MLHVFNNLYKMVEECIVAKFTFAKVKKTGDPDQSAFSATRLMSDARSSLILG